MRMGLLKILSIASMFLFFFAAVGHAATFTILNNCLYTVWGAVVPGGGRKLDPGESWTLNINGDTTGRGRIWARTNCIFDENGKGMCQTGDCGGHVQCESYGTPPVTLAEYVLNQFKTTDFFHISLVDGFNVPMAFNPTSNDCIRGIECTADIVGHCPNVLRAPGGCNNACTVFKTDEYCCYSAGSSCGPTGYSTYFKDRCPDAYTYPNDDKTSTFTCPGGTNYNVTFCPVGAHPTSQGAVQFQCILELF